MDDYYLRELILISLIVGLIACLIFLFLKNKKIEKQKFYLDDLKETLEKILKEESIPSANIINENQEENIKPILKEIFSKTIRVDKIVANLEKISSSEFFFSKEEEILELIKKAKSDLKNIDYSYDKDHLAQLKKAEKVEDILLSSPLRKKIEELIKAASPIPSDNNRNYATAIEDIINQFMKSEKPVTMQSFIFFLKKSNNLSSGTLNKLQTEAKHSRNNQGGSINTDSTNKLETENNKLKGERTELEVLKNRFKDDLKLIKSNLELEETSDTDEIITKIEKLKTQIEESKSVIVPDQPDVFEFDAEKVINGLKETFNNLKIDVENFHKNTKRESPFKEKFKEILEGANKNGGIKSILIKLEQEGNSELKKEDFFDAIIKGEFLEVTSLITKLNGYSQIKNDSLNMEEYFLEDGIRKSELKQSFKKFSTDLNKKAFIKIKKIKLGIDKYDKHTSDIFIGLTTGADFNTMNEYKYSDGVKAMKPLTIFDIERIGLTSQVITIEGDYRKSKVFYKSW